MVKVRDSQTILSLSNFTYGYVENALGERNLLVQDESSEAGGLRRLMNEQSQGNHGSNG